MRIYLDTAPVIYLVENVPPYAATFGARLSGAGIELVAIIAWIGPLASR